MTTSGMNMILPFYQIPSISLFLHTIQHTQLYIWRWCVWISPCASFSSSGICAGNLSYEPVSSEAQEHLELRTERQDNTLKASCSSLIARGSIPTISNLSPYLLSFIAEAWRAIDSLTKLGLTWALLAISVYLQLPQEAGPLRLKNVSVSVRVFEFYLSLWFWRKLVDIWIQQPNKYTPLFSAPSNWRE